MYYRKPVRRAGARSEFDVSTIEHLPRVDVFLVYQDAPGDIITAAVDAGARGIVIATAGAGATSGTQDDAINYAVDRGVVVVRSTRTGSGRIAPGRGPGAQPGGQGRPGAGRQDRRRPTVASDDLTPVKSRILLMLALTKTRVPDEVQRFFLDY